MTSLCGQLSKLAAIINNRCNQPAKKNLKDSVFVLNCIKNFLYINYTL